MKKDERILLMKYIIHERARLEDECAYALTMLRYRRPDTLDAVEFLVARERLQTFNEVSKNVIVLLKITEKENEK